MKKYFITFATSNWKISLKRQNDDILFIQNKYNFFDYYNIYDETKLGNDYIECFKHHFKDRGFAYWSWKPYIILKTLEKMNNDDILFYMDGGCTFPTDKIDEWLKLFNMFSKGLKHYDIGLTCGSATTENIAKKKILQYFNLYDDLYFKKIFNHYQAGIQLLYKNDKNVKLISDWFNFFKENYIEIIKSDFYDKTNEDDCFYHNGADQAIFHCLLYKNNFNVMNIGKLIQNYHMITRIRK